MQSSAIAHCRYLHKMFKRRKFLPWRLHDLFLTFFSFESNIFVTYKYTICLVLHWGCGEGYSNIESTICSTIYAVWPYTYNQMTSMNERNGDHLQQFVVIAKAFKLRRQYADCRSCNSPKELCLYCIVVPTYTIAGFKRIMRSISFFVAVF